jgi:dihydrofolate reductase
MGRKTWESLPKKPLKDRVNIVLTSRPIGYPVDPASNHSVYFIRSSWDLPHVLRSINLEPSGKDLFIIGGAKVYEAFFPVADQLELTRVHQTIYADDPDTRVFFPDYDPTEWVLKTLIRTLEADYETYVRIRL